MPTSNHSKQILIGNLKNSHVLCTSLFCSQSIQNNVRCKHCKYCFDCFLFAGGDKLGSLGDVEFKVDGTSFSDAGSLVTTTHLTREIGPRDLKYRKSKTNMRSQKLLLTRVFFVPVCPRLDQNKSCPLGVSC